MVEKEKQFGSVKRYGSRYGRTIRYRVAVIEAEQRKNHKCPTCTAEKVRRVAVGIWECTKCGAKFTGKAYSPVKKIVTRAGKEETGAKEEKTYEAFKKKGDSQGPDDKQDVEANVQE
jgi:large subunit ribosomal protein L37Ae